MAIPTFGRGRATLKRKLVAPHALSGAIDRPRLRAELDDAIADNRHVAVIAGSGYGKTCVLAQWARDSQAAWLSLDAEDADLGSFLHYLVSAIAVALPGFESEAQEMIADVRDRDSAMATVSTLIADIDEQCDRPLAVILDDYHLAESPTANALMLRLFRYLPTRVRIALSTRSAPDLEMATLQAKRVIVFIGEENLAFDFAEMRALRPDAGEPELRELHDLSGGWPARLGMTPQLFEAYVDEQVLAGQNVELRQFLLRLSVSGGVSEADTEVALGILLAPTQCSWLLRHRLIRRTEQAAVEVPQPLRGALQRRFLIQTDRAERLEVLRRLGDYLWSHDQPLTAIHRYLEAELPDTAAERLVSVADDWLDGGRLEALYAGVVALTGQCRADLTLLEGEIQRRWGNVDRAADLLSRALMNFKEDGNEVGALRARIQLGQIDASCGRLSEARRWLSSCGDTFRGRADRLEADALNLQGAIALLEGDVDEAASTYEASLHLSGRLAYHYAAARAAHNLAVCYTSLGDFGKAVTTYDLAIGSDPASAPPVWLTPINRALVTAYTGRLEEARNMAESALALVRRFKLVREEGFALRTLGFVLSRSGEGERAASCYESAELLARSSHDALALAYSLNYLADQAILWGEGGEALRLVGEAESAAGDEAVICLPEFRHVRARALLLVGRVDQALELCENEMVHARSRGFKAVVVQMAIVAAAALRALGRSDEAKNLIPDVRSLTLTGGFSSRLFAPELPPLVDRAYSGALSPQGGQVDGPARLPVAGVIVSRHELRRKVDSTEPSLNITCFGGMRIEFGGPAGAEVEWQGIRGKQILAYLLHHPAGAVKTQLMEAIYGNEAVTDASLNMNIMRLRKALEPDLAKGKPSAYILRGADGRYTFNRETFVVVDTRSFDSAARQGARDTDALKTALGLYQGEFLPEFDNDWVVSLRQHFRDRALGICRHLLAASLEHEEGEFILTRALQIDPYSEEFHREVILRFLESEEPHRALAHFDICERRFREALGLAPPQDLVELVASIRRQGASKGR